MPPRNHTLRTLTFLPLLAAAALTLLALGPITPPAGPVAATPGPEPRIPINLTNTPGDANSVFRITQPGSYYLTGNLTGVSAKSGIEIAANNVTIDLMGFVLTGVAGSLDGITTDAVYNNLAIVRGTITAWSQDGLDLNQGGTTGTGIRVEGVTSAQNTSRGIALPTNAVVHGCIASANGSTGIHVTGAAALHNCLVNDNGSIGIVGGAGSTIVDCTAHNNTADGIRVQGGSLVAHCAAESNGDAGIVPLASGCLITDCTASFNGSHGIMLFSSAIVRNCVCNNNGTAGSGAGITASGSARIEGNICTSNDLGIQTTSARCVVVRNTCASNATNYDLIANTIYGPILDRSAPASAAVFGSAGPGSLGTTDSNANFSH
jgi:parallel beta-helix repeat protein